MKAALSAKWSYLSVVFCKKRKLLKLLGCGIKEKLKGSTIVVAWGLIILAGLAVNRKNDQSVKKMFTFGLLSHQFTFKKDW